MTAQSSVNIGRPSSAVNCCDQWCTPSTTAPTANGIGSTHPTAGHTSYCSSVAATATDGLAKTRRLIGHVCRRTKRESRALLRLYCACLYTRIAADPNGNCSSGSSSIVRKSATAICGRRTITAAGNSNCSDADGNCRDCETRSATTATATTSSSASPSSGVSVTTAIIGMDQGTPVIPIMSPPEAYVFCVVFVCCACENELVHRCIHFVIHHDIWGCSEMGGVSILNNLCAHSCFDRSPYIFGNEASI